MIQLYRHKKHLADARCYKVLSWVRLYSLSSPPVHIHQFQSQSIELNVTKDELLVQFKSKECQLNYFLTVNEEAGESWRYNLRVGTFINNSIMKHANDYLCSLEDVF